jgi:hypothetical protein
MFDRAGHPGSGLPPGFELWLAERRPPGGPERSRRAGVRFGDVAG